MVNTTKVFYSFIALCLLLFIIIPPSTYGTSPSQYTTTVSPDIQIDRVIIKFKENLEVRYQNGELVSKKTDITTIANSIEMICGHRSTPLFIRDQGVIALEKEALIKSRSQKVPDLNSYYQVQIDDYSTAIELITSLRNNPSIEKVYIRPKSYPAGDIDPPTPDFVSEQGYLDPAPGGVDAEYAWNVPGGNGENVHIIDIEGDWNFDHEDFGDNIDSILYGAIIPYPGWDSHGTAILGLLAADSNEYGVTGIAHEATVSTVSTGNIGVAAAVDYAASYLSPGDLILIELNSPGPRYDFTYQPDQAGYIPEEYWDDTFDAVQLASAKGIIVCTVAGNGDEDLNDPIYEDKFNISFRNSRAIFVGAGAPPSGNWGADRSRLYFSNYGSRVNLQGWGKEVVSSGYGYLFDGEGDYRQHYTDTFGGTSAAAGIVCGVAASLQSAYQEQYGQPITVEAMVYLLDLSGTLQPNPTEKIGPRPDLSLALQSLQSPINVHTNPAYIEYSLAEGMTGYMTFFLINDNANSVSYDISIDDTQEGWTTSGWLDLTPTTGSVPANDSVPLEISFDGTVIPGSSSGYKASINIQLDLNPGSDSIFVPVFFDLICNDTNYTVYDSDYGQVIYNWIDITSIGTQIPYSDYMNETIPGSALDDGTAGPYSLGFAFNFFNNYYNQIYISTNGALSFSEDDMTFNGFFDDIHFPSPGFNNLISPFWNDLTIDTSHTGDGQIYYYSSAQKDSFIVSYEEVSNILPIEDSIISFQVILTDNGHIRYQYKETGIGGAPSTSVVGYSLDQECHYMSYFDPYQPVSSMPHNGLAVEFRPNFEFTYMVGDANSDGAINVSDAVYIINYVFVGGAPPAPLASGDTNCDLSVNVSDAVWIVNYVFVGGYAPGDIDGDGSPDC
jgi:Subtilase family/Dockerin type I domain